LTDGSSLFAAPSASAVAAGLAALAAECDQKAAQAAADAAAASAAAQAQARQNLSEGFTLDVDDSSFVAAPSFDAAMHSFTAARGITALSSSCSGGSSKGGEHPASGSDSGKGATTTTEQQQQQQEELVRLLFAQYNPTSSSYSGLDVEVVLKLSTLAFYCNR
jgi:hypothetical protein